MSKVASLKVSLTAVAAAVLMAFFALSAGAGTAWADGNGIDVSTIKATSTQKLVYFPSNSAANEWMLYGEAGTATFKSVTSSNKGVVSSKAQGTYVTLKLKKAGKSTVKFKYNGKSYKIKFVVAKYTNPVSVFQVGTVNYAKKFKKVPYCFPNKALAGKKLKVKASSAWKFVRFEYYDSNTGDFKKSKTLKKVPAGGGLYVVMKHKATGAIQYLSIWGQS